MSTCGRQGWPDDEQDYDNPCVCGLAPGHEGLHQCDQEDDQTWAGGIPGTEGGES